MTGLVRPNWVMFFILVLCFHEAVIKVWPWGSCFHAAILPAAVHRKVGAQLGNIYLTTHCAHHLFFLLVQTKCPPADADEESGRLLLRRCTILSGAIKSAPSFVAVCVCVCVCCSSKQTRTIEGSGWKTTQGRKADRNPNNEDV